MRRVNKRRDSRGAQRLRTSHSQHGSPAFTEPPNLASLFTPVPSHCPQGFNLVPLHSGHVLPWVLCPPSTARGREGRGCETTDGARPGAAKAAGGDEMAGRPRTCMVCGSPQRSRSGGEFLRRPAEALNSARFLPLVHTQHTCVTRASISKLPPATARPAAGGGSGTRVSRE